jgi:hypothetical protein
LRGAAEPRLRFDRVAVGLVRRLQTSLSKCVPDGRTVVVTITAPIRQDSRTGALLEERICRLLAARRTRLRATIHGNRVQVRVLKGRGSRGPRLIGFVHNPRPGASLLFDVARRLLKGDRRRIIASLEETAPSRTIEQVCTALRIRR